jgi:hypothetical protein
MFQNFQQNIFAGSGNNALEVSKHVLNNFNTVIEYISNN